MKIVILGATGQTGQHLVNQALQQGHSVTAVVRNPGKMTVSHDNLKVGLPFGFSQSGHKLQWLTVKCAPDQWLYQINSNTVQSLLQIYFHFQVSL